MPKARNQSGGELEKYDAMSTEELQKILREDASGPEGKKTDTEAIFYIMEVLARRRKERNEGKTPEEALASFKQYYCGEDGTPDDADSPVQGKQRSAPRWRRGLVAAAAVLVILVGGTLTAQAGGVDLWSTIAKWTQETFHFGKISQVEDANAPSAGNDGFCASLREALEKYDISAAIVPTWLPDGYTEDSVDVTETPRHRAFNATYTCQDRTIIIRIAAYLDSNPMQIEQSGELLDVYNSDGVDYYIFKNNNRLEAAWIYENFECCISGPLSVSEIEKIIDSVAKG